MKRRDPKITVVQAPISGVITDLGFRPGELNRTEEFRRLLTIVDPSRVWLEAQVYEHQSAAIVRGVTRASFTSPGLPSPRLLDRPIAVSGSVNPDAVRSASFSTSPNPGRRAESRRVRADRRPATLSRMLNRIIRFSLDNRSSSYRSVRRGPRVRPADRPAARKSTSSRI